MDERSGKPRDIEYFKKQINLGQSIILYIWHIRGETFLHFTWDIISCNFILISKASANCNSQAGMTSVGADLTEERFFFKVLFIFSAPHCEVPLMLCFLEAGLEYRWEKKGMKFYTLKHSVKIYIVSLVTWRLSNTLHWRISKPTKFHRCINK